MSNQKEIIMEIENHLKETIPLVCQACGGTGKLFKSLGGLQEVQTMVYYNCPLKDTLTGPT